MVLADMRYYYCVTCGQSWVVKLGLLGPLARAGEMTGHDVRRPSASSQSNRIEDSCPRLGLERV